jgi:hypothetical protein
VTPAEALELVHRAGVTGQFFVSIHGRERQDQRSAQRADIRQALRTASSALLQENGRWRVEGVDLDEDDLTLIVVFEDGVVVITVF